MKTKLYYALIIILVLPLISSAQQVTLAGWTFPDVSADALIDVAVPANAAAVLMTENPQRPQVFTPPGTLGGTDKCAQTVDWDNGSMIKYWMVEIVTDGYHNLLFSSAQRSCPMHHGPRDFKVQYKLSSQTSWTDLPGATVVDTANWTMGVLTDIPLPTECSNQSQPVAFRWLMISNMDIKGVPVLNTGMSRIDDILFKGEAITSLMDGPVENQVVVYPNPATDFVTVKVPAAGSDTRVILVNALGQTIETASPYLKNEVRFNMSHLHRGVYYIQIIGGGVNKVKRIVKS